MTKTRLFLIDDHTMFRQGLREILDRVPEFLVVGEASNGRQALAAIPAAQPDIVLVDIQLPDGNGIAIARQIAATQPQIKTIMLTMYRQDQHLVEASKAGARAYLLKDADAAELIDIIQRVQRGEMVLETPPRGADDLRRLEDRGETLTERERDILALVAAGHDNKTIAARLYLSEKTVGNRLSEIFQKLGVSNRTQAALVAMQRGIVLLNQPDDTP